MLLIKEALFLLLNAYIGLIARGEPMPKVRVCNDIADVAFLVDVSGSMGKDSNDPGYFDREIKPFLKSFVGMLNVGPGKIQVGLVTFGNNGYVQFTLKSNVNDIMRGIDNIVYPSTSESTNTADGILVMRTQVLGVNSPNYRSYAAQICIIVTDGQSTVDREYTIPYATDAKNQGITIFAIGATANTDARELVGIASTLPGFDVSVIEEAIAKNMFGFAGSVAYAPTIEDLNSIVQQVSKYVGQTDCKQAAAKLECKDNPNYSCNGMFPGNCYDPQTEQTCCQTCSTFRSRNPDSCRYGDRYYWCDVQFCARNYADCCATCPKFECKDVSWCNGIYSGQCYDPYVEMNCCRTCRSRLTGNSRCRYGDEINGCTAQSCNNSDSTRCCYSCPNTPCIDSATWCYSYPLGYCYDRNFEKTCCLFCRNNLRGDLTCRYDDQFPWCAQFCWDTTKMCCRSCPKYIR